MIAVEAKGGATALSSFADVGSTCAASRRAARRAK